MIKKAQSVKITDILEKGLSEEKKDSSSPKNKQISIVNLAEKQNSEMGTLDSISVFKAFY